MRTRNIYLPTPFDFDEHNTVGGQLGNEQETQRVSSDSLISAQALRELYLEPFRIAIDQADPKCIMRVSLIFISDVAGEDEQADLAYDHPFISRHRRTSYNRVNGTHASENEALLNVLRRDYGWRGLLLSDWNGTYSSLDSIKAGLDLEMPWVFPSFVSDTPVMRTSC